MKKFRWSKVYESTEEELTTFLAGRNITATHWVAEAFDTSEEHTLDSDLTLWCAEGSLTVTVDGKAVSLQPGDALQLPAGSVIGTRAGISGCICYES